jgi:hypothetical protein
MKAGWCCHHLADRSLELWQVHYLFRQLGLRHICVVPRPSQVVGVITRKDLLPEVQHPSLRTNHFMYKSSMVQNSLKPKLSFSLTEHNCMPLCSLTGVGREGDFGGDNEQSRKVGSRSLTNPLLCSSGQMYAPHVHLLPPVS